MKKLILTAQFLLLLIHVYGQEIVQKPEFVRYPDDSLINVMIMNSLDSLFGQVVTGDLDMTYLSENQAELTSSILESFQTYEIKKDSTDLSVLSKQLINIYPISKTQYFLSIAYLTSNDHHDPTLIAILNLVAEVGTFNARFSIPLDYLTRYWKSQKVGNITYHFRDTIQLNRAIAFDKKNDEIAQRFGLEPESFDFYMCDNYQEFLKLCGLEYEKDSNGKYRDGYGIDASKIFSIMNNEDFSHDIFHYYSGKVNQRINRNWITEEGIAYWWGNAYYTDSQGEMIEIDKLVNELKTYLSNHNTADLYQMFEENIPIFDHVAAEISTRSVISAIIARQVYKDKGMEGLSLLINCGGRQRLQSYLMAISDLIGINKTNFHNKVRAWIM